MEIGLTFGPFFLLLVHHSLLLHSLAIFDELVIKLVLDKTVDHTCTNNIVTLGHFVTHAARRHQFDHDRLGCLDPICLELLISNTVEEHFIFVILMRYPFPLDNFQIAFIVRDLRSNLAIEASIQFGQSELSLA